MKKICLFVVLIFGICSVMSSPKKIIFDTDMGNDVDDVIALDMLYKYQDAGLVDILGIISSKRETGSVKLIDAMGTIYGYPKIPLAITKTYASEQYVCRNKRKNYADFVVDKFSYNHTITDFDKVDDGYILLRKLLAASLEKDITIVAVGFSTNLARLIKSKGDEISPLSGLELIQKSVDKLVMMAGNFQVPKKEYNIYNDRFSATIVFEQWPTPIFFTDFELGYHILLPYTAIEQNFSYMDHHPVLESFNYYEKMPYNRPMWDATAVLFAVEPSKKYFSLSKSGYVTVTHSSVTYFYEDKKSNRYYYKVDDKQRMAIQRRLVSITKILPKSFSK
ncbi:MAG: nucleoside hydrolase [Alistipes sp.]|nr:nucleoside hydrolase [Candidatus Alistipes equi]